MVTTAHQWKLVGPWYRWNTLPEDPGAKRTSRPIIQKYADSNHVKEFLENPQRSLQFLDEDLSKTGKRKVFLDTHDRFYLVSCELHCDAPGFPKVNREQVCEAGFVVRKRKTNVPEEIQSDVENLLQTMSYERTRLNRIESKRQIAEPKINILGVAKALNKKIESIRESAQNKYQTRLTERSSELQALIAKHSITHHVQGWYPQGNGLGIWREPEEDLPQEIDEQIFPLYPLIPDETDQQHASGHKTIWYGLLPVGSADRDTFGNAQFDDNAVYEIRCFVRKHKDPCTKTNQRRDCKGEIVWSRPTEAYQLASHFDLIGTSNRMTMIQAPNIPELVEQVSDPSFQMGQGLGLGIVSPVGSELPIEIDVDGNPLEGEPGKLPSICFFAIPLITIVAMFLLRLILPIVVYLFSLWFLLRLKLCILPQISLDLDVSLEIEAELELSLDVELSASVTGALDVVFSDLDSWAKDGFDKDGDGEVDDDESYRRLARMALDQSLDFSASGIAPEVVQEIKDAIEAGEVTVPESSRSAILPNPADRLEYYSTKELSEVFV